MDDPHLDPASGVLRNRLGITDAVELARAEAHIAASRELQLLVERPKLGRFDLAHLQRLHHWLFASVYDWAGELRTINVSKDTTVFALAQHLQAQGGATLDPLQGGAALRRLDRGRFCERAGRVMGDLNALHPFRDGNGRTQRCFLQQLARQGGWEIAWAHVDPAENLATSRAVMGDPGAFGPLLERVVSPAGTLALEDLVVDPDEGDRGPSPDR